MERHNAMMTQRIDYLMGQVVAGDIESPEIQTHITELTQYGVTWRDIIQYGQSVSGIAGGMGGSEQLQSPETGMVS